MQIKVLIFDFTKIFSVVLMSRKKMAKNVFMFSWSHLANMIKALWIKWKIFITFSAPLIKSHV